MKLDVEVAMKQYKKRVEENSKKEHVDNSSLPAGSPMVFYCKKCGVHTDTLPELYVGRPQTICDACQVLVEHGLV